MDHHAAPAARRTVWPWILAIIVAAGLGAAGGWAGAVANRSDAPTAVSEAAATPSATTSAEPVSAPVVSSAVAAPGVLKLGQPHSFIADQDKVTVTALAHKRKDDYEGVQVRTCNTGTTTFPTSTLPWLLSYNGGEQLVDITAEGGGLLSPPFVERDLAPGKCVKGWISFEAPPAGKPDGVEYRIEELTSARWEW